MFSAANNKRNRVYQSEYHRGLDEALVKTISELKDVSLSPPVRWSANIVIANCYLPVCSILEKILFVVDG